MSTTIDNKVVEMRFDNKQFESGVQTSLSTLDKLKQSLNLTGASKGLESINSAAKNNHMNVLGSAVEAVSVKFSALQVMGVTALANITNSAINTGKRMVSALTIDPIKTGFQEYETQMNAVQTILANTQSKGSTLDDVNKALDTLNTYADKTIYNFTEMTRNIGTFTAAGVDLQTSVDSIQGIANLAAVSGSSSQQASVAMYQLSQALAAGRVSLMDWNSVVNAGMGGELFQNALIRTSELLKTGAKDAIATYGSFRESLTKGEWLTTEVLTETLKQLSGAYSEADLIAQGFTEEQAKEIVKLANTATDAATKVKTFTQLWDVLKESAQSGWSQTWKLIVGDFEQAKSFLTPLADFLTGVIGKISEARNALLESALGKSISNLKKNITDLLEPLEGTAEAIKTVTDTAKDYSKVVDEIINGDWGAGQTRWDKLTESGYDWAHAQNLVNEKLGDGTRHTTEYKEAQDKLNETQEESSKVQDKVSLAQARQLQRMSNMSDEQLRNLGYTEDQIKAFKELKDTADKLGLSVYDLVLNIDDINGRWLLLNSFKNIGQGIVKTFGAIRDAWREIFPPMSADTLFNLIAGFHRLTSYLDINNETTTNLKRTFKGLFALLDVATTIVGGGFKIALKAVSAVLGYFDMDVLDVTASIGDALVAFRDWIDSILDFDKIVANVIPVLQKAADKVKEWYNAFKNLPQVQKILNSIKDAFNSLKDLDFKEIGKNIIEGLQNGLGDGINGIIERIIQLGKDILTSIKEVLGIHSPSTEFFEIGKNIIEGLINGLKDKASAVWEFVKSIGEKCVEVFSEFDLGAALAAVLGVGMLVVIYKIADAIAGLTAPFSGFSDMCENIGETVKSLGKSLKTNINTKSMVNIAKAIAILAGSLALLALIPTKDLIKAGIALVVLTGVMAGLMVLSTKMGQLDVKFNVGKISLAILGISGSLLILAIAMKTVSSIDAEDVQTTLLIFVGMIAGLTTLMFAFGKFVKADSAVNMVKAGGMLLLMSGALLIMTHVIKQASKLEGKELVKGLAVVTALELLFMAIIKVSDLAGPNAAKAGGMLLLMSGALLIMIGVIKLAARLEGKDIIKGIAVVAALELLFVGVVKLTKGAAGKNAAKAGAMLLLMSGALLIMVSVIKQVSKLEGGDIVKGIAVVAALELLFAGIIAVAKRTGKHAWQAGAMLLLMSGALAVVTGILFIISKMDPSGLGRSLGIIAVLELLFMGLIGVTKYAKNCQGTLVVLTVAIGLLAAAIITLSFIDGERLASATAAISSVILVFGGLIAATKLVKNTKQMQKTLLMLLGTVVALAAVVAALSLINAENALKSSTALSLLLVSFATSMAIIGKTGRISTTVAKNMAPMLLVVVGLAGILSIMSSLNVEPSIKTAAAISVLLLAMSSALVILNFAGPTATAGVGTLALMGLVVAELALILGLMSKFNVEPSIGVATSLSVLLLAMSGALVILGVVGAMGPLAFIGIGALATLIAGIGGLVVGIGALMTKFPQLEEFLNKGIPVLGQIGTALGEFFGNIVGGFIEGAASGLPELGSKLSEFITNAQPFIDGIKTIDSTAIDGVKALAGAILVLTAADLISGIASFLSGGVSFGQLGSELSSFMTNAQGFINGASNVDPSVAECAKNLAGVVLALTAADVLNGLTSWFTGEKNFETFGAQLEAFGEAIVGFSQTVSEGGGINETAVSAAAHAGKIMAEMQASIVPSGGVIQWFCGEKNMSQFGLQLVSFGKAIVAFSQTVSEGTINETAITAAANAGKIMSEMQTSIVPSGGVIQWFCGEKNMSTFGLQLVSFGKAIVAFSQTVSEGNINEAAIEAAANAGKLMTTLQSSITATGGVVQFFTGEQNLETFGTQIVAFGDAIVDFSDTVTGSIDEGAVTAAANAGKIMAELQKSIPEDTWFDGKVTLSEFGDELKEFGKGIAGYSEEVAEVDSSAVSSSISAANRLLTLTQKLVDLDTSGIDKFKIESIGSALSSYHDNVSDLDTSVMASSISAANKLVNLINSLANIDTSGVASFKTALTNLGSINVDNFVNAFSSASSKLSNVGSNMITSLTNGIKSKAPSLVTLGGTLMTNISKGIESKKAASINIIKNAVNDMKKSIDAQKAGFKSAGQQLGSSFVTGIKDESGKAGRAMTSGLSSAVSDIRGYYDSFYKSGAYLVKGFANGIDENQYKAVAKARAMASKAAEAARKALDEHSPSRVFYKIGDFAGQGFVNALDDSIPTSYRAGYDMAESATSGLSSALNHMNDILANDMDTQPTIRPVLDLSDISSGVDAMNGMLSMDPSVGVLSNIGSISAMRNGQNRGGNDIVSAIKDLKKSFNGASGNTYNINGVTYDDGSNVATAVEALVKAARIERRI